MTIRQAIENGVHGGFVTKLYEAYNALKDAENKILRAFRHADMIYRKKMGEAVPGCDTNEGWDTGFMIRKLEEQFPFLTRLDDETADPLDVF